jgi:hypothetical protein
MKLTSLFFQTWSYYTKIIDIQSKMNNKTTDTMHNEMVLDLIFIMNLVQCIHKFEKY